jgi:hypothetical protein
VHVPHERLCKSGHACPFPSPRAPRHEPLLPLRIVHSHCLNSQGIRHSNTRSHHCACGTSSLKLLTLSQGAYNGPCATAGKEEVELTPQNKSTQPQQRGAANVERQRRARAAAIAAVAHAAPGQRELVMNEATGAATASVPKSAALQAQPQCEGPSHVIGEALPRFVCIESASKLCFLCWSSCRPEWSNALLSGVPSVMATRARLWLRMACPKPSLGRAISRY